MGIVAQCSAAVFALDQTAEYLHTFILCRPPAVLDEFLRLGPHLIRDNRLMGVLYDNPILFRHIDNLFAFERLGLLVIDAVANVNLVGNQFSDAHIAPHTVIAVDGQGLAIPFTTLAFGVGSRGEDFFLPQFLCDFLSAIALQHQVENVSHHRRCFLVDDQLVLIFGRLLIPIRCFGAKELTMLGFGLVC